MDNYFIHCTLQLKVYCEDKSTCKTGQTAYTYNIALDMKMLLKILKVIDMQ